MEHTFINIEDDNSIFQDQVSMQEVKNYKPKKYPLVESIEDFITIVKDNNDNTCFIVEIHDYNLREKIHNLYGYKYRLKTLNYKKLDFVKKSTIFTHKDCKGSFPYDNIVWKKYCDEVILTECLKCHGDIYSDNYNDFTLTKRHNIMKITKIIKHEEKPYIRGYMCLSCNHVNSNINWHYNDIAECNDGMCENCQDTICDKRQFPGYDSDGDEIEIDDGMAYSIVV